MKGARYSQNLGVKAMPSANGEYAAIDEPRIVTVAENTIGVGGILYLKSDGSYYDADADVEGEAMLKIVMALEAGTGQKLVMDRGYLYKSNWGISPDMTKHAFLSTTDGGIVQTAPVGADDTARIVGYFHSASGTEGLLEFDPDKSFGVS